MASSLALTALLMGLAGGPHCVAMCGTACAGIMQAVRGTRDREQVIAMPGNASPVASMISAPSFLPLLLFQAGRVLGYAVLGGLAAASVQGLGWLTIHSAALRPFWSFLHLAAMALGLVLMWRAAQPVWLEKGARRLWQSVRARLPGAGGQGSPHAASPVSSWLPLLIGVAWALLPCGLLYSALLVAALTGQAWQGAAMMALFALGTAVSMTLGPWLWLRLSSSQSSTMQTMGVRLAGLVLALSSAWALWMGLAHDAAPWCVMPA